MPGNNVSKATFEDASFASMSGSHGAKIEVLQSGALNSVLLSNVMVANNGSLNNKRFTFNVYAKGSQANQRIKLRVKYQFNGTKYSVSNEKTLGTDYPQAPYDFSFDVPNGTTQMQFQLICGADVGTYYFDNFSVAEQTLGNKKLIQNIATYPNPVSNKFYIEKDVSVGAVSLYNINGKKIKSWDGQKNEYDLSFLINGIYFIEIITENNLFCTKSIIKR